MRSKRHSHPSLRNCWSGLIGLLAWAALGSEVLGQAPPPAPEPTAAEATQARELFQEGVAHYETRRYTEALASFQEAYRRKPHPLVLVNIANCFDKLQRPVEAIENFEAFLASGEGSEKQRDEVRAAVTELQKQLGSITFRVSPPAARIAIDDIERPAGASEQQRVQVGRHHVSISATGYETVLRLVDVHPQETTDITVDLKPLPNLALEPSAPPAPAPAENLAVIAPVPPPAPYQPVPPLTAAAKRDSSTPLWLAGGATFALGVSAVVTGQLALAANRDFNENLSAVRNPMLTEFQRAGAWARGVDAANRADAFAAVTDVLLALTLVSAGLTTYFYLADHDETPNVRVRTQAGRLQLKAVF
jgi:hypothetical protein